MKKILVHLVFALLLCSCGVGVYSVSSGKSDDSTISFTDNTERTISITIDNAKTETLKTVKQKDFQKARNIKKTSNNTLTLKPGKHNIKVLENDKILLEKVIFISAGEHKIIAL